VADTPARARSDRRTVPLAGVYYLLAALAVTLWLWRDPASRTVAGNPNDADQFAWFFRYDAAAIAHFRLPALVTAAMNAPQGVNLMWNTPMLLPGVLLAPVTLLAGPQVSLTVLLTAGFAGSATAMFAVLRRWQVRVPAAALGAAVYGFSPALVHSAMGHYDLQFAVLPPLIADAALRLATGRARARPGGVRLGLLVTAQIFVNEEILLDTALAVAVLLLVIAAARPRHVAGRVRTLAGGTAVAAAVTGVLAGYPLWVEFCGPLPQHGSPFTMDFYKNDLASFVVPSSLMLFHTAGSAAQALRYQGQLPEYLGYLGWPLIVLLAAGTVRFWRRLPVRACAVSCLVLVTFSLGGTLLASGHEHAAVRLPWYWLQSRPLLSAVLPDRFSILADGAAGALLACCLDAAIPALTARLSRPRPEPAPASRAGRGLVRFASGPGPTVAVLAVAALAVLPIVPRPLPAEAATALPAGWPAAFAALRLPPSAAVLVVPVPMSTFTEPLRWQADTGQPASLAGGYFMGPGTGGQAATDGRGLPQAARYLNALWSESAGGPVGAAAVPQSYLRATAVSMAQMRAQFAAWKVVAVAAVTDRHSILGQYLAGLLGPPSVVMGGVLAWRW
jgi:hypothetical protein